MKKQIIIFLAVFLSAIAYSQVGVGTNEIIPDIVLQIESQPSEGSAYYGGMLFPRVGLTATNVFAPITGTPVTGLLVYNTATAGTGDFTVTPGFYFWNNDIPSWEKITQNGENDSALFANQDTTTDLNDGDGIFADIFANVRFNNNTDIYEKIDAYTLKINAIGLYKVILNLDVSNSGGADNFGMEIIVNDAEDIVSENIYIPGRWDNEGGDEDDFPIGKAFTVYVPIDQPGHTLKLTAYELDPGTDVLFKNANSSTISIQKIR